MTSFNSKNSVIIKISFKKTDIFIDFISWKACSVFFHKVGFSFPNVKDLTAMGPAKLGYIRSTAE